VKKLSLLIFLLLVPSGLVLAQWYVSYEDGRKAAMEKGGDLQKALALLTDAINDQSDSKANKRMTSLQYIDYFPYLYRGIAYYKLGELDKARADLNKEKDDGAINDAERDKGAPALLAQYLEILQKPAPQTAQQKPPPVVREKTPQVVEQNTPGKTGVTVPPLSQKKPDDQASGKSKKETSGRSIAAVISPKENPPPTHESVGEPAARTADTSGSALFREAVSLLNSGKVGQAKSAFQRVRAVAPAYPDLETHLGTIAALEEKTRTGISAFFRGEYDEAIENLGATSKNGSDNPHVYAFLACSYAAEYFLAGADNGNLKREAVEAFGRVKGIDPRYELDAQLISPGIIALLKGE
jgi:tetratricopeptide (TPR) repeat protein